MVTTLKRRPPRYGFVILILLAIIACYLISASLTGGISSIQRHDSPSRRNDASNATLGFNKILALSTSPSWRTRGLQAAATYSRLDIEVPKLPLVSDELAMAFRTMKTGTRPKLASSRAWLSHMEMLKYVIRNKFETALIIEDDVDWDVDIKDQMRLLADAVRKFTGAASSDGSPYGHRWDVLWIGHCGEHTYTDTERVEYPDATVPKHDDYTGWSWYFLNNMREDHRLVQRGINPVCTFAYAVTKSGAEKVLRWAEMGQSSAFDIKLMEACRPRILDVITVQPELMHHYTPPLDAGYWSEIEEGEGKGVAADESEFEFKMGDTENIRNSARCKALFDGTCMAPVWEDDEES